MTNPYWSNGVATLYQADARAIPLPDGSVHCCVTSPPYWGLRNYNLAEWVGGDPECDHVLRPNAIPNPNGTNTNWNHVNEAWPNGVCGHCGATQQAAGIGLEPTLSDWLANIVAVGREVWRVLRDDGSFWLNLGDSYAGSGKGHADHHGNPGKSDSANRDGVDLTIRGKRTPRGEGSGRWGMGDTAVDGLPAKNLIGQPWRAAFALQDDGWILRSAIVWHKPNPMPESVSDRPTSAYEMVFLLTKRAHYFYDAEAVREAIGAGTLERFGKNNVRSNERKSAYGEPGTVRNNPSFREGTPLGYDPAGRNARNVWQIPTQGRPEAHFATFPDELPRRCILAGTSEHGVCADCGAPWARQVEKSGGATGKSWHDHSDDAKMGQRDAVDLRAASKENGGYHTQTVGWQPTCECNAARVPATVLDPFIGSGTTCAVAQQIGRNSIGLDLNPVYLVIAAKRLAGISLPMAI